MNEGVHPSELMHDAVPAAILMFLGLAGLAFWIWARTEKEMRALANKIGLTCHPDGKVRTPIPSHSALHQTRLSNLELTINHWDHGGAQGKNFEKYWDGSEQVDTWAQVAPWERGLLALDCLMRARRPHSQGPTPREN